MHDIEQADAGELAKLKVWLFQENVRVQAEKQLLKQQQEAFEEEKTLVKKQIKEAGRKIEGQRLELDRERQLFDEKWKLLKKGFDELDEDRRALKRQEKRLLEYRRELEQIPVSRNQGAMTVFFRGVNDNLSLKKRYKDLLKIFHPDNIAGDKETVLTITQEYDTLRAKLKY